MAAARDAKKVSAAKAHLAAGKKLARGGMFSRAKPDLAEEELEKAEKALRTIRPQTPEVIALRLEVLDALAGVEDTIALYNSAAQRMETAHRLVRDRENDETHPEAVVFLRRAAEFYDLNEQFEKAAELYCRAGDCTARAGDPNAGWDDFEKAIVLEEREGRYRLSSKFFEQAANFCVDQQFWGRAIDVNKRHVAQMRQDKEAIYAKRIMRCCGHIMVVQFHLKDVPNARQTFVEFMNDFPDFTGVPEFEFCESLLQAFDAADEDRLRSIQSSGNIGLYLQHSFGRLCSRLNMDGIRPQRIEEDAPPAIDDADREVDDVVANTEVDEFGAPDLG